MVYDLDVYVIEDTDGTPIQNAIVTINNIDKLTSTYGRVLFTDIPEGLLNLYVNKTGYEQFWFQYTTTEQNRIYSVQAPLKQSTCNTTNCSFNIE